MTAASCRSCRSSTPPTCCARPPASGRAGTICWRWTRSSGNWASASGIHGWGRATPVARLRRHQRKSRHWSGALPALQLLPQEELLVTLGIVVERAEDFVAPLFVKRSRLEGVGVERDRMAAAFAAIGFGLVHQLRRPSPPARGLVDPEIGDVQPAAPDAAQKAAHRLAALALQEEVHRIIGRHAGDSDIEHIEAIAHDLRLGVLRLFEDDRKLT